jgi:hypothetical protein
MREDTWVDDGEHVLLRRNRLKPKTVEEIQVLRGRVVELRSSRDKNRSSTLGLNRLSTENLNLLT